MSWKKSGVTYWPSTEPSIKRCTCITGSRCIQSRMSEYHLDLWTWLNSVQMRTPTGSRWVSNNYIQVPQTAWVSWSSRQSSSCSWSSSCSSVSVAVACGVENQLQTEGWGPQDPRLSSSVEWGRSAAMVRETWGQYVAVSLCLQLTSHT